MAGQSPDDPGRRYHTEKIPTTDHQPSSAAAPADRGPDSSVRTMGMWLLLAALSVLFVAILVGFLFIRLRAAQWPPAGTPPLPTGLWVSTALLVLLSFVMSLAERGRRPADQARLLMVAFLLALSFLAAQVGNWMRMAAHSVLPNQSLFVWFFFVLTIIHAAHVVGGLVPLILVTLRARRGDYTLESNNGVHLVALYWHFLLVTWVAIMAVLSF